ncbi:MAG: heavy-metal-associated domain-containing protein [Streptosporangiaceae bacterium]
MTTTTYAVTGMTCEHCVHAVTEELSALGGVREVQVNLVAGGSSAVTVTSDAELTDEQVAGALDEAGDYHMASD